jgi:predicted O-methyltransferase YrrM
VNPIVMSARSTAIASRVAMIALLSVPSCKSPPSSSPEAGAAAASNAEAKLASTREGGTVYSKPYTFTEDWFSDRVPLWTQTLGHLRGRQDLRYLEIGVFEGRSALWMLENILTHPSARLTAIDIFLGNTKAVYLSNLDRSGFAGKATTIQGSSQLELRKLALDSFDIIYIDGSHTADDVLADAVLSWGLLRVGGYMIFDDYAWSGRLKVDEPPTPDELRPGVAIDSFITAYRNYLDVVHREWQMVLRKHGGLCPFKEGCTPVGDYDYRWWTAELVRRADQTPVALTERERSLLERFLRSRAFGKSEYEPDDKLKAEPDFAALMSKLGFKSPAQPVGVRDAG